MITPILSAINLNTDNSDLRILTMWFVVGAMMITAIVHVCLAFAVLSDAAQRRVQSRHLWFVPPIIWGLAVLLSGVIATAVYWAMHYSSLVSTIPMDNVEERYERETKRDA